MTVRSALWISLILFATTSFAGSSHWGLPKGRELLQTLSENDKGLPPDSAEIRKLWELTLQLEKIRKDTPSEKNTARRLDLESIAALNEEAMKVWDAWAACAGNDVQRMRTEYYDGKPCPNSAQSEAIRQQVVSLRRSMDRYFESAWIPHPDGNFLEQTGIEPNGWNHKVLENGPVFFISKDRTKREIDLPYLHPLLVQLLLEDISTGLKYVWEGVHIIPVWKRSSLRQQSVVKDKRPEQITDPSLLVPKKLLLMSYLSTEFCTQFGLWRSGSRVVFPSGELEIGLDFSAYPRGIQWGDLLVGVGDRIGRSCLGTKEFIGLFIPDNHRQVIKCYRTMGKNFR